MRNLRRAIDAENKLIKHSVNPSLFRLCKVLGLNIESRCKSAGISVNMLMARIRKDYGLTEFENTFVSKLSNTSVNIHLHSLSLFTLVVISNELKCSVTDLLNEDILLNN